MTKKLFCFFLSLWLVCACAFPACAVPKEPSLTSVKSAYLYCIDTGSVILSKSSEDTFYPAATVKLMTGLLAAELLNDRLSEKITVTNAMLTASGGTSMPIRAGEAYTIKDLYYAAVCGGFNDATSAIAYLAGGSMEAFVALMNERASALGATHTHFTNPTGKHDEAMTSTISDMAIIAKAASKSSLYMTASSASSYTMSDGYTVRNRNGLIGTFYAAGHYNFRARGLVAGDTTENGFSVASVAEYDGLTFLVMVNAPDKDAAYSAANELFDYAFYHYGPVNILQKGEVVASVPLSLALAKDGDEVYTVPLVTPEEITLYVVYDRSSLETLEIKPYLLNDELVAPIKAGDVVGAADVYLDGRLVGSTDLVAGESVAANPFLLIMSYAKDYFLGRSFIISFIIFVVLFSFYFYVFEIKGRRTQVKKPYRNIKNLY